MPKKTPREHPKAVAARERKKLVENEKEMKKQKDLEDNQWLESDPKVLKKLRKKEAAESKKREHDKKKSEAKALLQNESTELKKKPEKEVTMKLTRMQISKNTEVKKVPGKVVAEAVLDENVNTLIRDEEVARSVEEAISVFEDSERQKDKHPEKRRKAAYKSFEERRLKEFKAKNSTLKLSQLKQLIFKEWQKCPENPIFNM